jgi:hypothetical protein
VIREHGGVIGERVRLTGWERDERNGCVTRLDTEEGPIDVQSWGGEGGDWFSAWHQHRRAGTQAHVVRWELSAPSPREFRAVIEYDQPTGRFRFVAIDRLMEDEIQRDYRLEAVDGPTGVGDFVVRAAFGAREWPRGEIVGRALTHRALNELQMHPVQEARLENDKFCLVSEIVEAECPRGMQIVSYLRDQPPDRWILHHRFITTKDGSDEFVLRLRYSTWGSRRHPLLVNPLVRKLLWRWSERHWGKFGLPTVQVCGTVYLSPGEPCRMKTRLAIHRRS